MDYIKIASKIPENQCLSKSDIVALVQSSTNEVIKESSASWLCKRLIDLGLIVRVGRNQYCSVMKQKKLKTYQYYPSDYLADIIVNLSEEYPLVEFQAWETIQFNYFVNHQIAHNTVFIEVENMLEASIYDFLRDKYKNNVLLKPDVKTFEIYAKDSSIIVMKMISETPVNKSNPHLITIEKLLVDMLCNKLIPQFVSKNEFINIYEEVFERYRVDESKLFRYARRRNSKEKLIDFLNKNTCVKLKTEEKNVN